MNGFSQIGLNKRVAKCLGIGLCLLASHAGQAQTSFLADDVVARIAKSAGDQLLERYPFPDLSRQYADALSAKVKSGSYHGLDDCALAKSMTEDLRTVHKDVHLHVFCDSQLSKALAPRVSASGQPSMKDLGFEGVDLDMDTATAYIRSQGGWQANADTFAAASHAMGLAAQAKYVIIDVRGNPGGSGEMGRFLASYFFADGDEQYYLYGFEKDRERSQQEWTYAYVPGARLPEAKVYILVNKNTASAAEGFAYALQRMKRATIVGQTTAGAGIAGEFEPLPAKMSMFLPVKMVVAPHTTIGWEGVGVVPDVSTAPDGEREAAMALIRKDRLAPVAPAAGTAK